MLSWAPLAEATSSNWPAKIRRLASLAAAGFPIPPGIAVEVGALEQPSAISALRELHSRAPGPWAIRGALTDEDGSRRSLAGTSESRRSQSDWDHKWASLCKLSDRLPAGSALFAQEWLPGELAVCAVNEDGVWAEIFESSVELDRLSSGDSPREARWLGSQRLWPVENADEGPRTDWSSLGELALRAKRSCADELEEFPPWGWDLEMARDAEGDWHLLQARPLNAELVPGSADFLAAAASLASPELPHCLLLLDSEHNPSPLSPAHAWLIEWVREEFGGRLYSPRTILGWLFVEPNASDDTNPPPIRTAKEPGLALLRRLVTDWIPAAETRARALRSALRDQPLAASLEEALTAAGAALAVYADELIPQRKRLPKRERLEPAEQLAASLWGRSNYLEWLPARWDIDSPSLAEMSLSSLGGPTQRALAEHPLLQTADASLSEAEALAGVLIREWDDILFALAIAPLRLWWLEAARRRHLHSEMAFALKPGELLSDASNSALRVRAQERIRTRELASRLRPPPAIEAGRPRPAPSSFDRHQPWLAQHSWGGPFQGPLEIREDLEALLQSPPPPGAVLGIPALSAVAAPALESLQLAGVLTHHGGRLSHAALILRELGIPAAIGIPAFEELKDRQLIRVNEKGRVEARVFSDPTRRD